MEEIIPNELTEKIIGCAIEVHRNLGPGLLESIYQKALGYELDLAKISYEKEVSIQILYKNQYLGEHRLDFLIENLVIVELKATNKTDPVFYAQLLSYLKLTNKKLGLLMNFNVPILINGIKRICLCVSVALWLCGL